MPRTFRIDELEFPDLPEIPIKLRRKVMYQAAKVVALRARILAPDSGVAHKGKLKRSITYGSQNYGLEGVVKSKDPISWLVHNGTKAHLIPAPKDPVKLKKMWRLYPGGKPVHHPGMRAQPFLVEAGEATKDEVERVLKEGAEAAMAEAVS